MHDGRQLAAARALAGLGVQELTASGDIAPPILRRLEIASVIHVSKMERHDHVQRAVFGSDHGAALAEAGGRAPSGRRIIRSGVLEEAGTHAPR
jgi:hypothetical protein